MSDPAIYQACSFRPLSSTDKGSRRVLVGNVRWRISPELDLLRQLQIWEDIGYKTGLNILEDQTVVSFSYLDAYGGEILMDPARGDVPDLESTLGKQRGYRWVAFSCPARSNREPRAYTPVPDEDHAIEFTLTLTLATRHQYRELIGAASRHVGDSFRRGSMNALWVVPVAPFTAP
jgi:hypothetical protein